MTLLTFAHHSEAQCFLDHFEWQTHPSLANTFLTHDLALTITGEGRELTLYSLTRCLSTLKDITHVVNLGVAGWLRSDLATPESVVRVRTSFAEKGSQEFEFKSFSDPTATTKMDCISANSRVLNSEYAQQLSTAAPLVDRELWSIAWVCQQFRISWQSFKLVSDLAGDSTACFEVQANAVQFSQSLLNAYLHEVNREPEQESPSNTDLKTPWPGFYLTRSQRDRFEKLCRSLQLKLPEQPLEKIWDRARAHLPDRIETFHPKRQTQEFLFVLDRLLSPHNFETASTLKSLTEPFENQGIAFIFDKTLDSSCYDIKLRVSSAKQAQAFAQLWGDLPFEAIEKALAGDQLK